MVTFCVIRVSQSGVEDALTQTLALTPCVPGAEYRAVFSDRVLERKYPDRPATALSHSLCYYTIFRQVVGPIDLPHEKRMKESE